MKLKVSLMVEIVVDENSKKQEDQIYESIKDGINQLTGLNTNMFYIDYVESESTELLKN